MHLCGLAFWRFWHIREYAHVATVLQEIDTVQCNLTCKFVNYERQALIIIIVYSKLAVDTSSRWGLVSSLHSPADTAGHIDWEGPT